MRPFTIFLFFRGIFFSVGERLWGATSLTQTVMMLGQIQKQMEIQIQLQTFSRRSRGRNESGPCRNLYL